MDLKKRLQKLKQRSNKSVYGDYIFSRVSALDTCQSEERVMLVEIKKINKEEIVVVTSRDIAETFEKEHKEVVYAIEGRTSTTERAGGIEEKNKGIIPTLIESGEPHVEKYFILSEYQSRGKNYKEYFVTRDGFVLLVMGFSGEKAMKFKLAYIKQFNAMEKALIGKIKEREKGIAVRQTLTNALQKSQENERMHGHAYSTYTNVIYKAVFGKDAKNLREEYGISKKENLRDYFSEEELKAVQDMEMIVSGLVGIGWGYEQIKEFIMKQDLRILAA